MNALHAESTKGTLHESNEDDLKAFHTTKEQLPIGTLVEVLAEGDLCWYGEINGDEDGNPIVTYIEADEDNVHAFQSESYVAPREAINRYVTFGRGRKRESWKVMGFIYIDRHEIVPIGDMNSDESDEDWSPAVEHHSEDEDDEDEDDSDEDDSDDEDEETSDDSDQEGDSDEDDEDDDEDEEEKQQQTKKKRT